MTEVSHKSDMAGPFNRGDTITNKHFTLLFRTMKFCMILMDYPIHIETISMQLSVLYFKGL